MLTKAVLSHLAYQGFIVLACLSSTSIHERYLGLISALLGEAFYNVVPSSRGSELGSFESLLNLQIYLLESLVKHC